MAKNVIGQTDESNFIGHCPTNVESPIQKRQKLIVTDSQALPATTITHKNILELIEERNFCYLFFALLLFVFNLKAIKDL